MEFYPTELRTNYMKSEYAIVGEDNIVFSWGAINSEKDTYQTGFRIVVSSNGESIWDSGDVISEKQSVEYEGIGLKSGAVHEWTLELTDNLGNASQKQKGLFKTACFEEWKGQWVKSASEKEFEAQYFVTNFELDEMPCRAVLHYCGIGLSKAYINGEALSNDRLQPAFTNYVKECEYVTDIINIEKLNLGKNTVGIVVGGGWRKNYGHYLDNLSEERKIEFMGDIALNAQLVLYFKDDKKRIIATDTEWKCMNGAITYTHLFNGEIYDEYKEKADWNINHFKYDCKPVVKSDFNTLNLSPQLIEPVRIKRVIKPVSEYYINGKHIFDFGENLAGTVTLFADGNCNGKVTFKIKHAELTKESGELFTEPLRGANAEDLYIAKSGECRICHTPEFTYHGFRYAQLEIDGDFCGSVKLEAVSFYTDIDTDNHFRCSDMTVNEFYDSVIRTERANLHSVATDCPQRDERMGWLNDATVRFSALKYNFMPIRLFEKIIGDISNEQDKEGRITCTAPFVYGERPADPVCSSFLIAAREHYFITGDVSVIKKYYKNFVKWNDYLKSRRDDGIVNYSYYGDWAGPADCCYSVDTIGNSDTKKLEEYDTDAANSIYVPGELISTALHYWNYRLLGEFAQLLGNTEDENEFEKEAELVQKAFLKKWYHENGIVHNGTQACQSLALYVKILPKSEEYKAAQIMNEAVRNAGFRLQTANITTPMLMNMLFKYGYGNTAWKLLIRTEYPSWGYMFANGATTIWERFELKKNSGMNSHNHPMYGAALSSLYEGMAGVRIVVPTEEYEIKPFIPEGVKYYEMKIPTVRGGIYIKAENKYERKTVCISVPFGVKVKLNNTELRGGFHCIELDGNEHK